MGSSVKPTTPGASPEFLEIFRRHADASGTMTFARFMELALYHPSVGYYRRSQPRVGRGPGTDFYTASTSGPIFGELVVAACLALLGSREPRAFTFVEIGAEPTGAAAGGVLAGVHHPFGAARTARLGEPLTLAGNCVVFSNELFDAQPCVRSVFRRGRWRDLGVRLDGGRLIEVELPSAVTRSATEGDCFDQPLAAAVLAEAIASQPWSGLFVAIDYGKSLRELAEETPAGTVRAYYRHTLSNDLLARPGEQDLTCHVCWDWLAAALARHGFAAPVVESQEAFFIHHAAAFIAATTAAEAAHFSRRKLALLQLLHPGNLGQKFQVLHARRD